ncbi:hypothetical protein CLU79DRAFT_836516 [Phycomyces nitens]|nr:hypothetical protein CLU79DRAFT_836516 [Phycomyces nitens]
MTIAKSRRKEPPCFRTRHEEARRNYGLVSLKVFEPEKLNGKWTCPFCCKPEFTLPLPHFARTDEMDYIRALIGAHLRDHKDEIMDSVSSTDQETFTERRLDSNRRTRAWVEGTIFDQKVYNPEKDATSSHYCSINQLISPCPFVGPQLP